MLRMQSYRYHITAYLQVLLALFLFASCIGDKFWDEMEASRNATDKNNAYYLALEIKSDANSSLTRADGDIVDGNEYEHKVGDKGNIIIFFDKDEKLFGIYDLTMSKYLYEIDEEGDDDDDTKEASYTYITKFFAPEKAPSSCLVVLNGSKIEAQLKGKYGAQKANSNVELDGILKEVWAEKNPLTNLGFENGLFTMTNSVYAKKGNVMAAQEITPHIAKTPKDAKNNALKIYVERMVAKFSFGLKDNKNIFQPSEYADMIFFDNFNKEDNNSPQYTAKKWRIEVTGWNINALETTSHLFKNIRDIEYFTDWQWNDSTKHRSYWSEDPHYDYQYNSNGEKTTNPWDYPWQYRKSIDYALNYYEDFENKAENLLKNYSFNQLNLGKPEVGDFIPNFEETIYRPENTYSEAAVAKSENYRGLDSRDELLAGTHLLVGAELQIQNDEDEDEYTPLDFYRDRTGLCYFTERACVSALVHSFNQTLKSQSSMIYTCYDWDKGGEIPETNGNKWVAKPSGNTYNIYYRENQNAEWTQLTGPGIFSGEQLNNWSGDMMPIATVQNGDGKRLPWIVDWIDKGLLTICTQDGNPLKIYTQDRVEVSIDADGKRNEKIIPGVYDREADKNDIKSLLYEWLGAIEHFYNGKMYYAHGIDNPDESNKNPKRYGVVRNNWYRLNLTDVKSIGIPIDDVTQPIVPGSVDLKDMLNVSVWILDWHHVEATAPFPE